MNRSPSRHPLIRAARRIAVIVFIVTGGRYAAQYLGITMWAWLGVCTFIFAAYAWSARRWF